MKYNLVIGFSVLAFVITTVWRWSRHIYLKRWGNSKRYMER